MTDTPVEIMARAMAERRVAMPAKAFIDDAEAALSALEREGFVVVPKEPTEAMAQAFYRSCDQHGMTMWRYGYRAMLSARPTQGTVE